MATGDFELTHRLLGKFYPFLSPLLDLLPREILRRDDSDAFRSFLRTTIVTSTAELTLRVEPDSSQHRSGMREIIELSQKRLFKAHNDARLKAKPGEYTEWKLKSIIALGYKLDMGSNISRVGQNTNTIVASLCASPEWQLLLDRIGCNPLVKLFGTPTTALFSPLANGCYLQIAGFQIVELQPTSKDLGTTFTLETDPPPSLPKPQPRSRGTASRKNRTRSRKSRGKDHDENMMWRAIDGHDALPPEIYISAISLPIVAPSQIKKRPPLQKSNSAPLLTFHVPPSRRALVKSTSETNMVLGGTKRPAFAPPPATKNPKRPKFAVMLDPVDTLIVRKKMYYSRPASRFQASYGLNPQHVLCRLPTRFPPKATINENHPLPVLTISDQKARHLLKHIFPRHYGLRSGLDIDTETNPWIPKLDYSLDREIAITKLGSIKTHPRLKPCLLLAQKLFERHDKAEYRKVLDQRCPSRMKHAKLSQEDTESILELLEEPITQCTKSEVSIEVSQRSLIVPHGAAEAAAKMKAKPKFSDYACTPNEVEMFVGAIVRKVIPKDFWGSEKNFAHILKCTAAFLQYRRYETTSVHRLLQGFSILDCDWLRPPSAASSRNINEKPNQIEMEFRREMLMEFIFWYLDSFIIDLVKTNFYVTECASTQNRSIYFRQDDWTSICRPLLEKFGSTMFEQIPNESAKKILAQRKLTFSYIRLLPKEVGVRPIANLKRRGVEPGNQGRGKMNTSINGVLRNTFNILTFEKNRQPEKLGATVTGPSEIHARLKKFKASISRGKSALPKLYFVKVDVKACFDTIKQDKLLSIIEELLIESEYRAEKYNQVQPVSGKVAKKWNTLGCPESVKRSFPELATKLAEDLRNAILCDTVEYPSERRQEMLDLIAQHVTANLVRIGGKFYKQRDGIPQGSILSSLLCNFFYADMERICLAFTADPQTLLLRYVDDFLLITTKKPIAVKFLRSMDQGHPEYGCFISAEKRLTNFDLALDPSDLVPTSLDSKEFPWCGYAINTTSLDIISDTTRYDRNIADSLTVERCRKPGAAFVMKMLKAVKAKCHIIYCDTTHNSTFTVYLNIYQTLLLVALKYHAYIRSWKPDPKTRAEYFLHVIDLIIAFTHIALKTGTKVKVARQLGAQCRVRREWTDWLGRHAFHRILKQKAGSYGTILNALSAKLRTESAMEIEKRLRKVVEAPTNSFAERKS